MKEPQLIHLSPMKAAKVYSLSQTPEEDALKKIRAYTVANGLAGRLFGRNIYPTSQPEPHGYEYYLTVEGNFKANGEATAGEVPGGLYAVLEIKNLFTIGEGWQKLFGWVEANGYEAAGVVKGEYGWVNCALEELVDWQMQKPPEEWVFQLMVLLKE
jgi:effector-binding domain-containing protein